MNHQCSFGSTEHKSFDLFSQDMNIETNNLQYTFRVNLPRLVAPENVVVTLYSPSSVDLTLKIVK